MRTRFGPGRARVIAVTGAFMLALAVGHDLQADPALALDRVADAGVLERVQATEVLRALLGEQCRVLRRVDALDLRVELRWAQQAAHVIRARRSWT